MSSSGSSSMTDWIRLLLGSRKTSTQPKFFGQPSAQRLYTWLTTDHSKAARLHVKQTSGADPGIYVRGGGRRLPFLPLSSPFPLFSLSFFLLHILFPLPSPPLRSRSPLNQLQGPWERCKLPQRGPGRSPSRKQIWCTLKLWESHWSQSFWIFWKACFTVARSKFSTS